jgi:hypothetical protein
MPGAPASAAEARPLNNTAQENPSARAFGFFALIVSPP